MHTASPTFLGGHSAVYSNGTLTFPACASPKHSKALCANVEEHCGPRTEDKTNAWNKSIHGVAFKDKTMPYNLQEENNALSIQYSKCKPKPTCVMIGLDDSAKDIGATCFLAVPVSISLVKTSSMGNCRKCNMHCTYIVVI